MIWRTLCSKLITLKIQKEKKLAESKFDVTDFSYPVKKQANKNFLVD